MDDLKLVKLYTARMNGHKIYRKCSVKGKKDILVQKHWPLKDTDTIGSRTRTINGYEVPNCLIETPEHKGVYYMETLEADCYVFGDCSWTGTDLEWLGLARGILHDSPEGAKASCMARLGIHPDLKGLLYTN